MKEMNPSDIERVAGGCETGGWYGPFEVYQPGQPIDPRSPWAPPVPGYPF